MALIIIVLLILKWKFASSSPDFNNEKSILAEIEVYVAYGREKQAIKLLEKAVVMNPESEAYRTRLVELENS
jgi:tetratricopeptide (TPR) repeat protein